MESSNEDIIKAILHYQERLEKYNSNKNEDKLIYVIRKLSKLPIKTLHLENTGIGRTVNSLKKLNGKVGDSAKDLVLSWKEMVLEEEKAAQETSMETEEDADSVYSSENDSRELQKEDGKENMHDESDIESASDSESKNEVPTKISNYLENETSTYKDDKYNNKYNSTESNSDREKSNGYNRKRDLSSDSSSDERSRHKLKKSKRDKDNSRSSHYKDKSMSLKDERDKKHEKHVSSSKSKSNNDRSESKHKSKKVSEQSNNKSEKHSKHEDKTEKDKKSSHSSKHKSSSSQSSKKDSKDKKEKDKHESRGESSSSKSSEKKPKERSKDEKKKSTDSHSNSQSKTKPSTSENGVKKEKRENVKQISKEKIIHGIDSESGATFAEALGMCGPLSSQNIKKKSSPEKKYTKSVENPLPEPSRSKTKSKYEENSSNTFTQPVPNLLEEEPPEPLNICLSSLLPEITPNYKPTPINLDLQSRKITYDDDEALSRVMSNKNQRTKVYSGNKTVGKVESLFQLCVRILQDNIDALEYTGGVPYHILKPIIDRATPDQLFNLEHHNPYLIEDTDDLWQLHCQKDFRTKKREELESWREMYMRCLDEREARLSFITANIKQSQDKSEPLRTTKLAYIDSGFVKPPRNVARQQAKNGTIKTDRKISPSQKLSTLAKSGDAEKIAVPNPAGRAAERSSVAASKPKKAPLMAKTLSFLKNRFKR